MPRPDSWRGVGPRSLGAAAVMAFAALLILAGPVLAVVAVAFSRGPR